MKEVDYKEDIEKVKLENDEGKRPAASLSPARQPDTKNQISPMK